MTSIYLPFAVGALYVREYFNENSKRIAAEMADEIKDEFTSVLKAVPWMDNTTRTAAIEKVKAMGVQVGYPSELMDDEKLIEYHKKIVLIKDQYLLSALRLTPFKTGLGNSREEQKYFFKPEWKSRENFAMLRPRYMNFASIGFAIGHEIMHGFDSYGSQFDSEGNLVDWWEKATKAVYLKKVKCTIEQYGKYTEPITKLKLKTLR
jgi:predicted metalloendopeptidase